MFCCMSQISQPLPHPQVQHAVSSAAHKAEAAVGPVGHQASSALAKGDGKAKAASDMKDAAVQEAARTTQQGTTTAQDREVEVGGGLGLGDGHGWFGLQACCQTKTRLFRTTIFTSPRHRHGVQRTVTGLVQ